MSAYNRMPTPAQLEIARALPPLSSSVERAQQYTRWLATHHYENFIVVTFMLPRRLRQHFYNVYAYCRWADDLADEVDDRDRALESLDWWEDELLQCYAGSSTHPVFIALSETIQKFDIPITPFSDLLVAFRQDQTVTRYRTWESLMGYCRYSANPVGRLVLYLGEYRDAERQALSDSTCSALQLANFWQDVSVDLGKDRIYIPIDEMIRHGLNERDVVNRRFDERYVKLMRGLVERTHTMFLAGLPLASTVDEALRVDIELFSRAGMALLNAIEAIGYNTLQRRPKLTGWSKFRLLTRAVAERAFHYVKPSRLG